MVLSQKIKIKEKFKFNIFKILKYFYSIINQRFVNILDIQHSNRKMHKILQKISTFLYKKMIVF